MQGLAAVVVPAVLLVVFLAMKGSKRSPDSTTGLTQSDSRLPARVDNSPIQLPEIVPQPDFDFDLAEIQALTETLQGSVPVNISKTTDPMDDHLRLTLTFGAVTVEGCDGRPVIVIRADMRDVQVRFEAFCFIKENFFFRRGKEIFSKLRFDDDPAFAAKVSHSTDLGGIFFDSPVSVVNGVVSNSRLKVQIIPEHGVQIFSMFDMELVRPAVDIYFRAILGPDYKEICKLNAEVVHWVLICGPKNTYLKKLALKELGYDPGPLDYSKPLSFFQAAQDYAERKRTSEISGKITDHMWTYHLYNDTSERIRAAMGPLTINQ